MEIKHSVLGFLIYTAMFFYLAGFLLSLLKFKRLWRIFYFAGFALVVTAFILRWVQVNHLPMQVLFDIFLCMGMVYPVSVFCRRFLKVGVEPADMLLGFIILFPAGFVFSSQRMHLPPALQSWLFGPHVAVYLLAYILMAKASIQSILQLCGRVQNPDDDVVSYEQGAYTLVRFGFVLLTVGLILGCYWGKLAWGEYWSWDPKEMWGLAIWLMYVLYFHYRYAAAKKHPRINSILVLMGLAVIIANFLMMIIPRLQPGLHNYAG